MTAQKPSTALSASGLIAAIFGGVVEDAVRMIFEHLGPAETQLVYWGCPGLATDLERLGIGGCRVSRCVKALATEGRANALTALRQIGASCTTPSKKVYSRRQWRARCGETN